MQQIYRTTPISKCDFNKVALQPSGSNFYTCINAQKTKFSIKNFFSKCDQIHRKLMENLMENFIFCVVYMGKI